MPSASARAARRWSSRCSPISGSCGSSRWPRRRIAAVRDGRTTFHPKRWENTYFNWMENIHDWCISRQLWWGHRIPAYWCERCGEMMVAAERPATCVKCGGGDLRQEEDVLDTWFSSALWPFSTLGWPDETPELATLLSDEPAHHRLRHHFFLGRADDDDGARVSRARFRFATSTSRRWCATSSARR